MRSTTFDDAAMPRGTPLGMVDPTLAAGTAEGLRVLNELLLRVARPRTYTAERSALEAIRAIRDDRVSIAADTDAAFDELRRNVQYVRAQDVEGLAEWLQLSSRSLVPSTEARKRRHALLIALTAKVVATTSGYDVPAAIDGSALYPWSEGLAPLLTWMPTRPLTRTYGELAGRYLEVTQEIVFDVHLHPIDATTPEEFDGWPWWKRLVQLRGWRARHRREGPDNPTLDAGRLEFRLARNGSFRRLERDGGLVARRWLTTLGYRDVVRRTRPGLAWVLGALVAVISTTALLLVLHHRMDTIAGRDRALADHAARIARELGSGR